MIKQIYAENLYNFKEGVLLDFTTSEDEEVLFNTYADDNISNISILYGKNNVGKSNLLKIISDVKDLILRGKCSLQAFTPDVDKKTSIFEIILENKRHEIRYGFEVDIHNKRVIDEWLFSKKGKNSKESKVFIRSSQYFSRNIKSIEKKMMQDIDDTALYINEFNNIQNVNDVIDDVLTFIKSLDIISYNKLELETTLKCFKHRLRFIHNDKFLFDLLNKFIHTSDLDIEEIKITTKNSYNYELAFVHKSKAEFSYEQLSSGTKQLLNILVSLLFNHNRQSVIIFDEIENGLHVSLVELFFKFVKSYIYINKEIQLIVTTHREELLDYRFISNDNKVFLREKTYGDIEVRYLSEYILSEHHLPSKRYILNAFDTNPNTSQEYDLHEILHNIEEYDNE